MFTPRPIPSGSLAQVALARLSEKWTAPLLTALSTRPRHYGLLRRELGVSAKVLATTLRGLERDGFVSRSEAPAGALQVSYALTELGRALLALRSDVEAWAERLPTTAGAQRATGDQVAPASAMRGSTSPANSGSSSA